MPKLNANQVKENIRNAVRAHMADIAGRINRNQSGVPAPAIHAAFGEEADLLHRYLALGAKLARGPQAKVHPAPVAAVITEPTVVAPVAPTADPAAEAGVSGEAKA